MSAPTCKVHVAFRFHTNLYHSYRGDTPDEHGFGKDIRIIRLILDVLDKWNAKLTPVKGTWDIENLFSLGDIIPKHAPDIIERIQLRHTEQGDEVEIMSYNNGLINVHSRAEFEAAIGRAIHNSDGSGNADIFGDVAPVVRPQEMMFTPAHIKLYREMDIEAVSLYYSGIPFNAFSNFLLPLPFVERYNPLTLTYPDVKDSIVVLPAYNHGDIGDHLSLRRWVKQIRRQQLALNTRRDVLLILDADADDEFWAGYPWPIVKAVFAAARGLDALIASIADLDYIHFTTPYRYLQNHPPIGSITFGQDTADGSFDGFASWAEKWSNHQLWMGIERARILEEHVRKLEAITGIEAPNVRANLEKGFELRLRALSTTHFGLSAPVMNRPRLYQAANMIEQAVSLGQKAKDILSPAIPVPAKSLVVISHHKQPGRTLIRMTMAGDKKPASLYQAHQFPTPLGIAPSWNGSKQVAFFLSNLETQPITFTPSSAKVQPAKYPVQLTSQSISNRWLTCEFDSNMHPVNLRVNKIGVTGEWLSSAVKYAGKVYPIQNWEITQRIHIAQGHMLLLRVRGETDIKNVAKPLIVEREYMLHADLPWLYLTTRVHYPTTESKNYNKAWAENLGQTYDGNWQEVRPSEIILPPVESGKVMRVWKHNYLDHVSSFDLDFGRYSRNCNVDSLNNAVTNGWIAISDGRQGLLLAQDTLYTTNFAFCPMRVREKQGCQQVSLNPFGSYSGKQWHYPTADTGLGKFIGTTISETLKPFAPSYNGKSEAYSLMIAPYIGDQPPDELQRDAMAFAHPPILFTGPESGFKAPDLSWKLGNG